MRKFTRNLLMALVAVTTIGTAIVSSGPASARSWFPCYSFCFWCAPSAECLVSQRDDLWKHSADVTDYLSTLVDKYRDLGASESEVEMFLDKLEIQLNNLDQRSNLWRSWFISSAHAQSPTDVSCFVPALFPTVCIPTQIIKGVGVAIGALGGAAALDLAVLNQERHPVIKDDSGDTTIPSIDRPRALRSRCVCNCRAGGDVPGSVPQRRAWRFALKDDRRCPVAAIAACKVAVDRIPEGYKSIHHVQASCSDGRNYGGDGNIAQ